MRILETVREWIKHTWHHHQDGKTLFPLDSRIHSREFGRLSIDKEITHVWAFTDEDMFRIFSGLNTLYTKSSYFSKLNIEHSHNFVEFNASDFFKYSLLLFHGYDYTKFKLINTELKEKWEDEGKNVTPEDIYKLINEIEYYQVKKYELIRFIKNPNNIFYRYTKNVKQIQR